MRTSFLSTTSTHSPNIMVPNNRSCCSSFHFCHFWLELNLVAKHQHQVRLRNGFNPTDTRTHIALYHQRGHSTLHGWQNLRSLIAHHPLPAPFSFHTPKPNHYTLCRHPSTQTAQSLNYYKVPQNIRTTRTHHSLLLHGQFCILSCNCVF